MAYEVPDLPYDYDALEPHIDEATMRVHHDKHHQAYVDKANAALEGTEWAAGGPEPQRRPGSGVHHEHDVAAGRHARIADAGGAEVEGGEPVGGARRRGERERAHGRRRGNGRSPSRPDRPQAIPHLAPTVARRPRSRKRPRRPTGAGRSPSSRSPATPRR